MAGIDYKHSAEISKERLFSNEKISSKSKAFLKDFFKVYDVSPARISIFCKHISLFLEQITDPSLYLDNEFQRLDFDKAEKKKKELRTHINNIFHELKNSKSKSYYATIVNVSNRFMRWLNDDAKPYSFRDIKSKKKDSKRDLNSNDHIDIDKDLPLLLKACDTVQLKALLMVQLEWGLRPSELLNLVFGDVNDSQASEGFVQFTIKDGKTGGRPVSFYHATPYILEWLREHPTKNPKDPLWLLERPVKNKKNIIGYNVPALQKRLKSIFEKAGVHKKCDLYALRHSAGAWSKLRNENPEFASAQFGHSIEYYENTYGQITLGDKRLEQHKRHVKNLASDEGKQRKCLFCGYINPFSASLCGKCTKPLTLSVAKESINKVSELEKQMNLMQQQMALLMKNNELKSKGTRLNKK